MEKLSDTDGAAVVVRPSRAECTECENGSIRVFSTKVSAGFYWRACYCARMER